MGNGQQDKIKSEKRLLFTKYEHTHTQR